MFSYNNVVSFENHNNIRYAMRYCNNVLMKYRKKESPDLKHLSTSIKFQLSSYDTNFHTSIFLQNVKIKKELLKKSQNNEIANVAFSV